MASLREIAKDAADDIRDGIAWVVVWKAGRSWYGRAFWLDDTDHFEADDMQTIKQIMERDENAVMLNGYYCGHFGEDMNVDEIAAGINWHYSNGYNLLKDSNAIPEEPTLEDKLGELLPGMDEKTCREVAEKCEKLGCTATEMEVAVKALKRVNLGGSVFLGSNKGAGLIPFQREGDSRTPVKSIKTVSVPQMITNDQVAEHIQKNIDEGLAKRLEHHTERELGKK